MAKILHIANFNLLKSNGPSQNSMQRKISNGLVRIGHDVINYPDRDLCRMFGFGHMNFWGKRKLNEHLIRFCMDVRPDAIVMGHVDTIDAETFYTIKRRLPQLKILEWCVDSIAADSHAPKQYNDDCDFMLSRLQKHSDYVDVTLVTTGDKTLLSKIKTDRNQVGFFPNIVDKSIETGHAYTQQTARYDLLFAATPTLKRQFCDKWISMDSLASDIQKKVPQLNAVFPGLMGQSKLRASGYQDVCANSAMGLSVSHINSVYLYQSDRLAHLMGNGVLTFLDARSGYKDFFDDMELVFYATPEEVFDKLAFYQANPTLRMQIAKAGHDKYVALFNETKVAKYFSDLLFGSYESKNYPWGILV